MLLTLLQCRNHRVPQRQIYIYIYMGSSGRNHVASSEPFRAGRWHRKLASALAGDGCFFFLIDIIGYGWFYFSWVTFSPLESNPMIYPHEIIKLTDFSHR